MLIWAFVAAGGLVSAIVGLILFEFAGGVETERETLAGLAVTLMASGLLVMALGLVVLLATAVARSTKRRNRD